MTNDIKENLKDKTTWTRGLYMLLFIFCYGIAKVVIFAIVILQFLLTLFTRQPNSRLLKLGQGLCTYIYQILQFLTYNGEYHPYPLGAWPKGEPRATQKVEPQSESKAGSEE